MRCWPVAHPCITKDVVHGAHHIFNPNLRFDEVAVCSQCLAAHALVLAGECRHDNHLDAARLGGATQDIEHVEATNLGHHHIADDELRTFFDSHGECFFPIASRHDVIPLGQQAYSVYFAQAFVVFDKQNLNLCHITLYCTQLSAKIP